MRPVIIVNFKTYPQATGDQAVKLAKECEAAGKKYNYDIRVAVQPTDIHRVAQAVKIPVYAQHSDPVEPGQHTGFVTIDALKAAGATGALLNHSEHRMKNEDIIVAAKLLKKKKMDTVVIAPTPKQVQVLDKYLNPTFFCVEPAELIAGDVSVSHAKPDFVKRAVHATKHSMLVGAGVKTYEDLDIALELGAAGVLLASGIVKAKHRGKAFRTLLTQHAR